MFTLATTRFNNYTWVENERMREKYNYAGCIYCSPQQMSPKIDLNSLVFIIEMNNSQNKIMGIGLVRNAISTDKYYRIYEVGNYNRYTFKGKYRIAREEIDAPFVEILEKLLFKGKTHSKRGAGITRFPEILFRSPYCSEIDVKSEIKKMFLKKFGKSRTTIVDSIKI
jgi:hypothetical protein